MTQGQDFDSLSAVDNMTRLLQGRTWAQELVSLAGNRTAQRARNSQQGTSLGAQLKKKKKRGSFPASQTIPWARRAPTWGQAQGCCLMHALDTS